MTNDAVPVTAEAREAATDLAKQAEEIVNLRKELAEERQLSERFRLERDELRPDAEAMRKKRAADRKRMAGSGCQPTASAADASSQSGIPSAAHVAAAKAICRSGKFETGQGTCAMLCMEFLGDPRKNGCPHALKIHGKLALAVLECGK